MTTTEAVLLLRLLHGRVPATLLRGRPADGLCVGAPNASTSTSTDTDGEHLARALRSHAAGLA